MINEIKFTEKAIKQVNRLVSAKEPGTYFRISVLGGGCSGFKYDFSFDNKIDQEDEKINNIIIDKASLKILNQYFQFFFLTKKPLHYNSFVPIQMKYNQYF